ncbi:hypothetical protein AK51_07795 [Serratia nematodiphila DZ0503SBS1]|nr:hypothetical protein AK51_07795 [Serratia nematodiphila DZ0503SBS1]
MRHQSLFQFVQQLIAAAILGALLAGNLFDRLAGDALGQQEIAAVERFGAHRQPELIVIGVQLVLLLTLVTPV